MDNGLELTTDGYVLHPKPSAYRLAALVGLGEIMLGLFIVAIVLSSSKSRTVLVPALVGMAFALLAAIAWFTSLPPTLSVTPDSVTVLGGAHRRRVGRSHVTGVTRGLAAHRDKTYFVVLDDDRRDIEIPSRHFDPAGLEEAMARLGVPVSGDFMS